ncbi:ABC transporter ATP-binding protein [Pseudomonas lopnurensis]|uniref:ABC transporter ATP-binding protein n=1 Tax=Pseudomonas lopnurensis TaxID=1477517 RepID=UPI001879F348|nr:ABC transporter ATP-binding protein [Pseudomonas lopnurensis]MBE7376536.1 ABC transporter ATP-binding protein [Pseudomonas lopnurensis]
MTRGQGVLRGHGLLLRRAQRRILDGVDLALAPGEILALLGANGAGKTTLLRCLLGLLKPHGGTVSLDGTSLATLSRRALARRIAYVPQAHVAPFPYSVREVVGLGRLPHHGPFAAPGAADREAVETAIAQLGIGALAGRPYTELSGGERQLTLIARALAQGARILIMDEPVSGLDFGHQMRLLACLERLAADGYGILKTTHHPDHALACASRVALLQEGRIVADGTPTEVLTTDAIRRLYRVEVEILRSPAGRSAFVPAG